ncbi:Hypothetical predicted protein [Mytilus galloprovincialis]|uniref:Uncharacterized protein n=1 Tax=Mytilus galloprovincialis TaxID=29158 RepID=A0A8B6E5U7_MYTGA|nr:Hypothetical predicted protein [Mytilus galloprovincialis]
MMNCIRDTASFRENPGGQETVIEGSEAISCRVKSVNHFRITYLTIAEADEEFVSTCDDSGFLKTPKTPATSHSVDYYVKHYIFI